MPTVFLKKRKKTYQTKVKLPNGTWKQVSTKIKVGGAKERAKALEVAFKLQGMVTGLDRESPTEAYFLKLARDTAKIASPNDFKDATLYQFLTDWIADCEERTKSDDEPLAKQTFNNYQSTANRFIEWAGDKRETSFRRVTPEFIKGYVESRKKDGVSNSTIGKDLTNLRIPFETAWKDGKIAANPFKGVSKPKKDGKRRVLFSREDIQAMVKTLSGEWLTVFLLGLYTGARLGDCVRMRWESVDIFNGKVTFNQRKVGGEPLVIRKRSEFHLIMRCESTKTPRQKSGGVFPKQALSCPAVVPARWFPSVRSIAYRASMRN